ncbi:MAG: hypothetical protein GY774_31755 [Planctomycetes bacterium]|nr:hypothetical protein [Planctomycetota bacterium]
MPTRILYWNIENFAINKINNPSIRKRQRGSDMSEQDASHDRRNFIGHILAENLPDIFVVVEVEAGAVPVGPVLNGQLVRNSGEQGCMELLNTIRAWATAAIPPFAGTSWSLVPPLISGAAGRAEGIAVFYRDDRLYFVGPYYWPAGAPPVPSNGPSVDRAAGANGPYPLPWGSNLAPANDCLPARAIPVASPINAGQPENQLAGQTMFFTPAIPAIMAAPTPIRFPAPDNKNPFLTSFYEIAAPNRLINLLSYHASPNKHPAFPTQAQDGTAALAQIQEMTVGLGANVGVIVGDFNVSLFSPHEPAAYGPLMVVAPGPAYNRHLNPTAVIGLPQDFYVYTHIKPDDEVNNNDTNGYPGYGYLGGSEGYPGFTAIDNIFTRNVVPANMTVVNKVVGSPYNAVAPPPAGAAPGTLIYAKSTTPYAMPIPPPAPGGYPPGTAGGHLTSFRGWNNYGRIRSTSDHLPLIIDV